MGKYSTEIVMNFYIYGGNEQSTHKYVSESLGKETIDTNTYGKSTGHSGSYSTNYQNAGRELMTPDEVRMLENENAILFIRGEKPIIDKKYNTFKHKNFQYTEDGGYKPYIHGKANNAIATISLNIDNEQVKDIEDLIVENIKDYDFIIDEDLDEYLDKEEQEKNK